MSPKGAGDQPRVRVSADPIMRWLWPEPREYLRHVPDLVHGFGGRAFGHGAGHEAEAFLGVGGSPPVFPMLPVPR